MPGRKRKTIETSNTGKLADSRTRGTRHGNRRQNGGEVAQSNYSPGAVYPWLTFIFIVAIMFRVGVHMQAAKNDPSYGNLQQDEITYHGWALSFSHGEMPRELPFAAPPFYSFVLGNVIFNIFGDKIPAAYYFNHLLALINIYLLFLLGRKLWSNAAGLIAAAAYSFYPAFMMLEMKVMVTTFFITFTLLALYWGLLAKERDRTRDYIIAGLMMGLASIARPTFLVFVPFYLIWLFRNTKPASAWLRHAAFVIIGIIPAILPVTLGNLIGGHDFVPITTTAGLNFYIGNHEDSFGGINLPPGFSRLDLRTMLDDSRAMSESETGRTMKDSEVSAWFAKKTLRIIAKHPGLFMKHLYWKLRLALSNAEISDIWGYESTLQLIPLLRWLSIPYAVIVALAGFGIVMSWGRNPRVSMTGYYIASALIVLLAFFVNTRYRLPIVAVELLFAGIGISSVFTRGMNKARFAAGIIVAALIVAVSLAPLTWLPRGTVLSGEHYNLGIQYLSNDRLDRAKDEFLKELELDPAHAISHAWLGYTQWKLGDADAAAESFVLALKYGGDTSAVQYVYGKYLTEKADFPAAEHALLRANELDPGDAEILLSIAELYYRESRMDDAMRVAESIVPDESMRLPVLQLLGTLQRETGHFDESLKSLREALEIEPDDVATLYSMGLSLVGKGDYDEALGIFNEALKIEPAYPGLYLATGDAYYFKGEFQYAKATYLKGIEIQPDSYELYHNLGLAYGHLNDTASAIDSFNKAIALKPDYVQAYYNLGNIYIAAGDSDNATANLERCLAIDADYVPAMLNLGTIYAQLGDYDRARGYWERVVAISPDSNEGAIAKNNLKALDEG